jgi:arylsulfatase A-like enzyme
VHSPYRTGVEESYAAVEALMAEGRARLKEYGGDGSWTRQEAAARMREIYRQGARALDELFGPWLEEVRATGILEHGCLIFTSDHGEAFYEHSDAGHGGVPFEEKARIPLFFHGAWLAPRTVDVGASLVDVPSTVAAMADIPPLPTWEGRDLLAAEDDRVVYNFVRAREGPVVTLVEGPHKVMTWADPQRMRAGDWMGASNLARDPHELEEPRESTWPAELVRAEADEVRRLLKLLAPEKRAHLSEEDRAHLNVLGYGDDGN